MRTSYVVVFITLTACARKEGEPTAEPVTAADFQERFDLARQRNMEHCCEQAGLRGPKSVPFRLLDPFMDGTFDAEAAAACLAETEDAPCELANGARRGWPLSCGRVYATGTRALDESCHGPWDCAPSDEPDVVHGCYLFESSKVGACIKSYARHEGESCAPFDGPRNPVTAWTQIIGSGDDALRRLLPDDVSCVWPLLCDERHICVRRTALGKPCDLGGPYGDACEQGTTCDVLGTKRCVKPTAVGAPCTTAYECEGLACVGGVCREPLDVIQQCQAP